jgi:hypothetical protein
MGGSEPSLCHSGPTELKPCSGSLDRRKMSRHGASGCTPCVECSSPAPKHSLSLHCCSALRYRPGTPDSFSARPCPRKSTSPCSAMSTSSAPARGGVRTPSVEARSIPLTSHPHGCIGSTVAPAACSTATAASAVAGDGSTAVCPRPGRFAWASCSIWRCASLMSWMNASCVDMPGGGVKPTCSKSARASASAIIPVGVRIIGFNERGEGHRKLLVGHTPLSFTPPLFFCVSQASQNSLCLHSQKGR